jgi:hypothetical protein
MCPPGVVPGRDEEGEIAMRRFGVLALLTVLALCSFPVAGEAACFNYCYGLVDCYLAASCQCDYYRCQIDEEYGCNQLDAGNRVICMNFTIEYFACLSTARQECWEQGAYLQSSVECQVMADSACAADDLRCRDEIAAMCQAENES